MNSLPWLEGRRTREGADPGQGATVILLAGSTPATSIGGRSRSCASAPRYRVAVQVAPDRGGGRLADRSDGIVGSVRHRECARTVRGIAQ